MQQEALQLGPVDTTRKLDFIVAGTARSGTTAVVQYLQAVDTIHCGNEIFSFTTDHATLHPPHCFFDEEMASQKNPALSFRPKYRKGNKLITAKAAAIQVYGNKTPRYIYRLNGLLSELARPRAVVCTRSLQDVAVSYARRALTPGDKFTEGRTGIYAIGDFIALCYALAMAPGRQVMVLPHRALLADWRQAMTDVIGFITPIRTWKFDEAAIADIQAGYEKRKLKKAEAPPAFPPFEQAAVNHVLSYGIEPLLDRDRPFLLAEVQDDLRAATARLPDMVPYIQGLAAQHPLPASAAYVDDWTRHSTRFAAQYAKFQARTQSSAEAPTPKDP